jgi:hypothetical protein
MRPLQRVVVNDHRHTVAAQVHVKLDAISSGGDRRFERGNRVLRRNSGRTTMSND